MFRRIAIATALVITATATAAAQNPQAGLGRGPMDRYYAHIEQPSCPDSEAGTQARPLDDVGCWAPTTESAPTEGSWLQLRITPANSRVYVNGTFVGYAQQFAKPYRGVPLGPGPQRIEIWAPGYGAQSFWMTQERERTSTLSGSLVRQKTGTP